MRINAVIAGICIAILLSGCVPPSDNGEAPLKETTPLGVTLSCDFDNRAECPTAKEIDQALVDASICMGIYANDHIWFEVKGTTQTEQNMSSDIHYSYQEFELPVITVGKYTDPAQRHKELVHQILHYLEYRTTTYFDKGHTHPCLSQYPIQQ